MVQTREESMKRWPICIAGLVAACSLAAVAPARAGTSVDIQLHVGDRYPGTEIVFHREPDLIVVPSSRVYYVRDYDYDMYRYGSYWYYCDGVNWYRARSYGGPFLFIHYRTVPRAVYTVPVRYRRHWRDWPPGHAYGHYKKADRRGAARDYRHDVREDRREDRRDERRDDRRESRRDERNRGR
jgi:hypothetical protein